MSTFKKGPPTPVFKKIPTTPLLLERQGKTIEPVGVHLRESESPSQMWPWLISLLVPGLIILSIVSAASGGLLKSLRFLSSTNASQPPITTLHVQRTAPYAGLNFTILTVQYATSFNDDTIHVGPAVVRVNIGVTNKTTQQIPVIYYDVLRLLVPNQSPIAPTNILSYSIKPGSNAPTCDVAPVSPGPNPGASETDCIDFPVTRGTRLSTLSLQLGSMVAGESLVTVPFSGAFDPSRYADRTSPQSLTIYYNFNGQGLTYYLKSVDIRFDYQGHQCRAGQQFYVLNFTVDNPNGFAVSPGTGFDYVRLVLSGGDRPPIDNTLPDTFNAGASGVGGRVVFSAPPGLKTLTIGFLSQDGNGQQNNDVTL